MTSADYAEQNRESLSIFHLNYDCLEQVFINVNPIDLVNLAIASSRFKVAAAAVYKRNMRGSCLLPSCLKN